MVFFAHETEPITDSRATTAKAIMAIKLFIFRWIGLILCKFTTFYTILQYIDTNCPSHRFIESVGLGIFKTKSTKHIVKCDLVVNYARILVVF